MAKEVEAPTGAEETQSIDIEAATAEISSDLFGQGEDEASTTGAGVEEGGAEPVDTPPAKTEEGGEQAVAVEENSAEVQAVGAPKTWTKEALETWATIPERAKQEITKREEDFMRGIGQYKERAELGTRYEQVVDPYRAALAAENIDPVNLFTSFAANHYLLARGTPEQKVELAANLISGYGIDFNQLATFIGGQELAPSDPEITALRKEIADLRGGFDRNQNAALEVQRGAISAEVAAFADDSQHPYFEDVADDMTRLINAGSATSLQDAYDKAVWANSATRQKELERLETERVAAVKAEEQKRTDKRRKSMGDHVETIPTERSGTAPLGSMDDTLKETLSDISSRE